MAKEIIIILLLIALFYYYRQSQTKEAFLDGGDSGGELDQVKSTNSTLVNFLRNNLNSNSLEELQTKLGEKTLDELLEENEDYETEIDTLTRTKQSLEQDLTAQAEAFQARLREKDRETKKLKEDLKDLEKVRGQLTSEKQQHKGSLERIKLLTTQLQTQDQNLKELQAANQAWAKKQTEHNEQAKELAKLKEQNQFYLENIKIKERIIEEYKQEKQKEVQDFLTERIKDLQTQIFQLDLNNSSQYQKSKELNKKIRNLEELAKDVERERERERAEPEIKPIYSRQRKKKT